MRKTAVRKRYDSTVEEYYCVRVGTSGGRIFDSVERRYVLQFLTARTLLQIGTATQRFT